LCVAKETEFIIVEEKVIHSFFWLLLTGATIRLGKYEVAYDFISCEDKVGGAFCIYDENRNFIDWYDSEPEGASQIWKILVRKRNKELTP
jgi:hypothetical protein